MHFILCKVFSFVQINIFAEEVVKTLSVSKLSFLKRLKNTYIYYINTNEIPGELLRENLISSHVKITCYLRCFALLKLRIYS